MPDDAQDAKAQKLAAARKKLKEFQQRNNNTSGGVEENATTSSTASLASNLSERSEIELNLNFNGGQQQLASGDATTSDSNLHAIQVVIAEKAQLTTELTKLRNLCRERELEIEELRTEHNSSSQRLEQLQQRYAEQQRSNDQHRNQNAELQHKLAQAHAQIEDQQTNVAELDTQIKQLNANINDLKQEHAEKCNDLDMAQLRIRQLSDESNINADNRVETLTQTQYMYEQQIRDLQAMVAQLTQDKEEVNTQYQNYVQHQSGEITKLNERNAELSEECAQLQDRERQLVDHVGGLERDIQKNLSMQAQYKQASEEVDQITPSATLTSELVQLQERLSDYEFDRHEFQLKIKSQNDQLQQLQQQLQAKDAAVEDLQNQLEMLQTAQPDQAKLLATMESDKVAASRALTQNVEMKRQLDELEQRFVQLTNDKAELVNKLDAEEFANREMRHIYATMQQKLQTNEERFKFKDEEMIRLSRENVELSRNQLMLQQQLDRLQHYEAKAYHNEVNQKDADEAGDAVESAEEHQCDAREDKHQHDHQCDHQHNAISPPDHSYAHATHISNDLSTTATEARTQLPTAEAVEKLQSRFTKLISQVADLTEEKQSLEHLVLQLQSETETIGEYIALYQTQRRMLKQREYEKATQMHLLQTERQQLREKIDMLNNLVASLGVELPHHQQQLQEHLQKATAVSQMKQPEAVEDQQHNQPNPNDSQQILHKIQDIITEIKENTEQLPTLASTTHAVDHLNCCLGKFEVV